MRGRPKDLGQNINPYLPKVRDSRVACLERVAICFCTVPVTVIILSPSVKGSSVVFTLKIQLKKAD